MIASAYLFVWSIDFINVTVMMKSALARSVFIHELHGSWKFIILLTLQKVRTQRRRLLRSVAMLIPVSPYRLTRTMLRMMVITVPVIVVIAYAFGLSSPRSKYWLMSANDAKSIAMERNLRESAAPTNVGPKMVVMMSSGKIRKRRTSGVMTANEMAYVFLRSCGNWPLFLMCCSDMTGRSVCVSALGMMRRSWAVGSATL